MDEKDSNILIGTITRKVICTLIKHKGNYVAFINDIVVVVVIDDDDDVL